MAFPEDRPGTYDADKYWDVVNDVWTAVRAAGQDSRTQYVLVISEEGDIYFRAI